MPFSAFVLGLIVTAGGPIGAALALRFALSSRLLGMVLAFGSGALICAVSIELALRSVHEMTGHGYGALAAWGLVAAGFMAGATIYTLGTGWLDRHGAAIRSPFRLRQTIEQEKRARAQRLFQQLAASAVFAQLPPEEISQIADCVDEVELPAGATVFRQGDAADALYVLIDGAAEVLEDSAGGEGTRIATLKAGDAFGEMAVLTGQPRSATVRTIGAARLLRIRQADLHALVESSPVLSAAVAKLGHARALENLSRPGTTPEVWARIASEHVDRLTVREMNDRLHHGSSSAGAAILLGNFLDVTPAAFVIGASFQGWHSLSLPLALGIFIADLPEAATSAAMLRRAGFTRRTILLLWTAVTLIASGAAVLGHVLVGASFSPVMALAEAFAGGAVLALVAQTMIPEAMDEAGPQAVLPLILGFLASLAIILQSGH